MATKTTEQVKPKLLYPWEDWCDGSTWDAKAGIDFDLSVESFQRTLHVRAMRFGMRVATQIIGDVVRFQFRPKESAQ